MIGRKSRRSGVCEEMTGTALHCYHFVSLGSRPVSPVLLSHHLFPQGVARCSWEPTHDGPSLVSHSIPSLYDRSRRSLNGMPRDGMRRETMNRMPGDEEPTCST